MPLEEEREEKGLLTPSEAQDLIALFAEREQARRAEAERIASMPMLADLASLLGAPVEALVPLLAGLRGEGAEPASGETRITQGEADRLLDLYNREEAERREREARRAEMTSLDDVAEGLRIPVDDAAELLAEVRRRRNPPLRLGHDPQTGRLILIPAQIDTVEQLDPGARMTFDDGLRGVRIAAALLVGVVVLVALIFALEHGLGPSGAYSTVYAPNPAPPPMFVSTGPPATIPGVGSGYGSTVPVAPRESKTFLVRYRQAAQPPGAIQERYLASNFPMPPRGWTVRVYTRSGCAEVTSVSPDVPDKVEERESLRRSVEGMLSAVAGQVPDSQVADPTHSAVPWLPSGFNTRISDLAASLVVEVAKGDVVRSVYVPVRDPQDADVTAYSVRIAPRLDYLAGLPSGTKALRRATRIELVELPNSTPPPGTSVTVAAGERVFRASGPELGSRIVSAQQCQASLERSIAALLRYAASHADSGSIVTTPSGSPVLLVRGHDGRARLVDAGCAVTVCNGYHTQAFDIPNLLEAASGYVLPSAAAAVTNESADELARMSRMSRAP